VEKTKKVSEAISGRDSEGVRQELMAKTKLLYCNLQDSYEVLSRSAKTSNIKAILNDFAREAERDCRELDSLSSKNFKLNVETAERHYGMFGQLLSADDSSMSEEEKVLIYALKLSDNLRNVFSIMSKEYKDSKIRDFFEMLSKHEIYRENELEQLYEDLVVKGEW
jgi:rubrerythrin